MDKHLRLKIVENSIPRRWDNDQGLIYSRLIIQPTKDWLTGYRNQLFLLTIKKKSYRAQDFKEKRIGEKYRLEIYPPMKGIYLMHISQNFGALGGVGSYGLCSLDKEVFVNSYRGKMFGTIGYRSEQLFRVYEEKDTFKLFEQLNFTLFKISRASFPDVCFLDQLFAENVEKFALLTISSYNNFLAPFYGLYNNFFVDIGCNNLTRWRNDLQITFGGVVKGLNLETLDFMELLYLQILLDGAQLGYGIIGAKNPLENLFYYFSINASSRFIDYKEDLYYGLLQFIALWKNYDSAHKEDQFLEDVKKFYPYIPFELQDDNMDMDIPKNFWFLDLTMGTKFFNELQGQRKDASTDLREYMEYIYYVEGPCFLVHYELEKFRNFYLNNRFLKVNVKGPKLPLEILSFMHHLFFIKLSTENKLLAEKYGESV